MPVKISLQLFDQLPITYLKGVGPNVASKLERLNIKTVQDLLFHLPLRYQDRTRIMPIRSLRPGDDAVIEGTIELADIVYGKRRSLLCRIADGSGLITLRFFYFNAQQQKSLAQRGARIRCYGEVRWNKTGFEMIHPEYRLLNAADIIPVEQFLTPIYPTTEGLHQLSLRKLTEQVLLLLNSHPELLPEYLPANILQQFNAISLVTALRYVHRPPPDAPQALLLEKNHPTQLRLAFEELLAHQLSLLKLRLQTKRHQAAILNSSTILAPQFLQQLPFQLTAAQERVSGEIATDLAKGEPMLRLVQGDVGSGKTVVAALAALQAVEQGYQVAVMAPTELLVEQHFNNFQKWLEPLKIQVACLSGKLTPSAREKILPQIANGQIQLVVGTHALFQEGVVFAKLVLIVIDEQHRFGVHQRLALREKGVNQAIVPHQLIMTATPIPRTLAMTAYADLDCSIIDELPPGRTPVATIAISNQRRHEVVQRVRDIARAAKQVYWVCTLIEESEVLQCQAAEKTFQELAQALPELRLGLIHGRLKAPEKAQIMLAFKNKEINLLIATTVVEVGVDVPNASLMIIENPERLGLAQLHQLRGRVGRGNVQSHCVLLYQAPLSFQAKQRLDIMRQTQNGFVIAERDLEIRGPGEVLGTRQTGLLQFKVANLIHNKNLLDEIQRGAKLIVAQYPAVINLLLRRWLGEVEQYGNV